MEKVNAFLKRKNIVFSAKRYGIDALGAMAPSSTRWARSSTSVSSPPRSGKRFPTPSAA